MTRPARKTFKVTIKTLREPHTEQTCRVLAMDHLGAIDRAIKRLWGRAHYWVSDSSLGLYYGQVGSPVPARLGGGTNLSTDRMRAVVEP